MTASAKVFEFDRERILSARRERLSRVYLDNLAGLPVWLGWRFEERNGKRTKVPYVGDAGKEPIKGSSTKPATWRTRAECDRWAAQHHGGIGIVLGTDIGDGRRLVGIDLDACIAENGELADWAAETIKRIGSYAETSPSGAGVKIFALVGADDTPPIALALQTVGKGNQGGAWKASATDGGKAPGVEIYTGGRFFTVTDDRLDDAPGDLRPVSLDTVRWLIGFASERFGATGKGKGSGSDKKSKSGRTDYSRSADALKVAGQGYRAGKFTDQAGMKAYLLGCDDPSVVGWTATKGSERRSGTDDYELGNIWQTISTVPAEILELNDTYALILTGGKTAVLKEAGADWELIGVDAFKQWHGNASVIDGRNSKPLGGYWLTHPRRRSYDGLVFAPEGAPPTKFNLWKGWATDPTCRSGKVSKELRN